MRKVATFVTISTVIAFSAIVCSAQDPPLTTGYHEPMPECIRAVNFNAGYGACPTYDPNRNPTNYEYCSRDYDRARGVYADQSCPECGICALTLHTTCPSVTEETFYTVPGSACNDGLVCEYGEESCCGETYPTAICSCFNGFFGCRNTFACYRPQCDDVDDEATDLDTDVDDEATDLDTDVDETSTDLDTTIDDTPAACPVLDDSPFSLIGTECEDGLYCEYGEETCCDQSHPSVACHCLDGVFQCFNTDACLDPSCEPLYTVCPSIDDDPFSLSGSECELDLNCEYGEETCCDGETYSTATCDCEDGFFTCYSTEPCESVTCEPTAYTTCPSTDGTPLSLSGTECEGDFYCEYGEETCCGETFPSTVCGCNDGSFNCYATDACLAPNCNNRPTPHTSCPTVSTTPFILAGSECEGELECPYGEEECCGETHPSVYCQCWEGTTWCHYTYACLRPACDEPAHTSCPTISNDSPFSILGHQCEGDLSCEYDEIECCGSSQPRIVCECYFGYFGCFYTGACAASSCD